MEDCVAARERQVTTEDEMAPSRVAWMVATGAGLVALTTLAVSQMQAAPGAPGLVQRLLGPSGQSHTFVAVPTGRDSAAGDCVVCHALDRSGAQRSAPGLWGIVGAPKARADWFAYSKGLRAKGGTWTAADLDQFLANPRGFVPGTAKTIAGITDPQKRQAIVAALTALHD
jgi:cytochrome c2